MLQGGLVGLIRRFLLGLFARVLAFWRSDSGNGCACEAGVSWGRLIWLGGGRDAERAQPRGAVLDAALHVAVGRAY